MRPNASQDVLDGLTRRPLLVNSCDEIHSQHHRVENLAGAQADVEEDPEELEAKKELDNDKDALAADKETDKGDPDAGQSYDRHCSGSLRSSCSVQVPCWLPNAH